MKIRPRITYFLTVLFLVNACQKDTTYEEIDSLATIENKAETINNGYNLKRANPSNIDLLKNRLKKNHSNLKWSKYQKATNDFWVDDRHVPVVVDSIGNKTYSFLIKSQSKMPNQLFNLIVIERTDGRKIAPFVMEYIFENSDKYSYQISTNRKFNGKINIYSLNSFISIHGLLTSRDDSVQPCYENISTQESSDSTSGGDSSTSTSTSDGTTGGTYTFAPLPVPSEEEVQETLKGVYVPEDGDYCSCYFPTEKGEITVTEDTTTDPDCPTEDVVVAVNAEEDTIINKLEGKILCAYEKLLKDDDNYNWITENFVDETDNSSTFNLIFEMSDELSLDTNGATLPPNISGIDNTFIIKINRYRSENINTNLTNARTLIHESIHVRLREFVYRKYGKIDTNNFPGIFDYYRRYAMNWDHQQMAAHYRQTIVEGLKYFDNNNHTEEYYNAIAWEGLAQIKDKNGDNELIYTEAWKELSLSEQSKILQIISNEKKYGNKDCF